jgi:hypothetical protein
MTETKGEARPRRDADGRLATIGDLLGVALASLVGGVAVLLLFEGFMSLVRLSHFGHTSGWLVLVLPIWLFVEEFRAAGYGANRVIAAIVGGGAGIAVGMTLAGFAARLFPALVSGAIGATGLVVVFCLVWFYGLRWLSHRTG